MSPGRRPNGILPRPKTMKANPTRTRIPPANTSPLPISPMKQSLNQTAPFSDCKVLNFDERLTGKAGFDFESPLLGRRKRQGVDGPQPGFYEGGACGDWELGAAESVAVSSF